MVLGKLPVPGVLLIWIRVGQGPTALAVGAGFFSRLSFLFSFSLSLDDGPILTEMMSKRPLIKPKNNQPTKSYLSCVTCIERI